MKNTYIQPWNPDANHNGFESLRDNRHLKYLIYLRLRSTDLHFVGYHTADKLIDGTRHGKHIGITDTLRGVTGNVQETPV